MLILFLFYTNKILKNKKSIHNAWFPLKINLKIKNKTITIFFLNSVTKNGRIIKMKIFTLDVHKILNNYILLIIHFIILYLTCFFVCLFV